ncbi:TPA: transcriptional regulator [Streptococcus suis]|nr:transcriptional regulator [Streptococcus suis]
MTYRLKELRKKRGLTQSQVANVLGTNQSQYGKYENKKTQLSIENAKKLANYFGVSIPYLLGLDDEAEMIATNFQILVKNSKKTLKEISEETGIGYSTLGNYNQGTRNPKRENAEILAKYFGVSTAYIMGIDEDSETKTVPKAYVAIGELLFNLMMDIKNQTVYEGVITTITLNHKKFKLTVEEIENDDTTRTEN